MSASRPHLDGRQSRWDQHNAVRREQILDAAVAAIEDSALGEPVHVRQVAERAGMVRPVIYRHFADKADLDRAIQARILHQIRSELAPHIALEGTADEIIYGLVAAYVTWADAHPALHRFAEQERAGETDSGALAVAMLGVVDDVAALIRMGADLLDVELGADEVDVLDPLAFGLVGIAFAAVRRWLHRPDRTPSAEVLARTLADTFWYVIDGHLRARGAVVDPHAPLHSLLG